MYGPFHRKIEKWESSDITLTTDFKSIVLNILNDLKGIIGKELKGNKENDI